MRLAMQRAWRNALAPVQTASAGAHCRSIHGIQILAGVIRRRPFRARLA